MLIGSLFAYRIYKIEFESKYCYKLFVVLHGDKRPGIFIILNTCCGFHVSRTTWPGLEKCPRLGDQE